MKFVETAIAGAFLIDVEPCEDERGFFTRRWCQATARQHGLVASFAQSSLSFNRRRGTLRGLHFQTAPHAETKLVGCPRGAIYDVIVDLRPDSPTRMRWAGVELGGDSLRSLYVPEGVAHGFLTLEDETLVSYDISVEFAPDHARGIRWDDSTLAVDWPFEPAVVSERDQSLPPLSDLLAA